MGNRQAATAEIIKWIDMLLPGSPNAALYTKRLAAMSDAQFDTFMSQLEDGSQILSLIAPNLSEHKLTIERNFAVAKELGHEFFERLYLTDAKTGETYLTPVKYLVVDLPLRRQQQLLIKKISIPSDNQHVDELTGQPSGPSAGSRASYPEIHVLDAQGFSRSIEELIKFRGGDTKARQALDRQIIETGGASQDAIKRIPTRVKSTVTLRVFLNGMLLDTNL